MYPITCAGGYALPVKTGRFEILGVQIPAASAGSAMRLTLVDSDAFKQVDDAPESGTVIFDGQVAANLGQISVQFEEPIKVRKGLTFSNLTNSIGGKNIVYIR